MIVRGWVGPVAAMACGAVACGYAPLAKLDELPGLEDAPIVFLQRAPRTDAGSVFQETSYVPTSRLVVRDPDGTLTTICCDHAGALYAALDISSYDLSADAKTIVFSARLHPSDHARLFTLQLADRVVTPLIEDALHDYLSPIFLPGKRVLFVTSAVVEPGAAQYLDERDRTPATQLGRVNLDGSDRELGPRHLSHRTAPSLASDGRVIFTQWDALGPANRGDLRFVDQDLQQLREGFGSEASGAPAAAYVAARELSPGRFVAVATAVSGTLHAGALIDLRLGTVETADGVVRAPDHQAEATATSQLLTPDVPLDDAPAPVGVGRYHDAFPLDAADRPRLLVAWADGPVQADTLGIAGQTANFGIYRYDSARGTRELVIDDPTVDDLWPRPLVPRAEPGITSSGHDAALGDQVLIGSVDAYDSSLWARPAPGLLYGVRVIEGFSSEEGFPARFGATGYEGQANLGVAPLAAGGSWSARIPANIPVHLQAVDRFGMARYREPVWISGRPGETMICGGCHESRAMPPRISAGVVGDLRAAAVSLQGETPRAKRLATAPRTALEIIGVPWDTLVQPILDAHCVACHDGTPGPANRSYTITDEVTGTALTWTFSLKGDALPAALVAAAGGPFSASYFSLAGADPEAMAANHLVTTGAPPRYLIPENAADSPAIRLLNPTQLFPTPTQTRAFGGTPHLAAKLQPDLNAIEYYTLILAADLGLNSYARENRP